MADQNHKSLTDMMVEINSHRYLQHRSFDALNGVTYMLILLSFDAEECLCASFHDVRHPLCYYTLPMPDFKALCGLGDRAPEEDQNANKLPEEMAAENVPAA